VRRILGMWDVAVETADNFVFEALRFSRIFGVDHFLNEDADLISGELAVVQAFAREATDFLTLVGRQTLDLFNDFGCAHV
jgi:hypothetical protein